MPLRLADALDMESTKLVEDTLANLKVESLGGRLRIRSHTVARSCKV